MSFIISCRATQWPFWLGFITPFLLVYIFDWIMFAIIVASIVKKRSSISNASVQSSLHRENLIVALSLAVVFGLGWGFGLLATSYPVEEVTFTFQILFSVFVGLQGGLLFLLHGVRNPDARRLWKGWALGVSSTASSLRKSTKDSMNLSNNLAGSTVPHTLSHVSDGEKVDLSSATRFCGAATTDLSVTKKI